MSIARLIPVLLCGAAFVGCEGASEPEFKVPDPVRHDLQEENTQDGNPFLGSWRLASFVAGDEVFDDQLWPPGILIILNFRSDLTHSWSVSNDVDHVYCEDPQTSCTWGGGTYTYTSTTLTKYDVSPHPDPGWDTGLYTLCGGRLIYMDFDDDGDGIRFTYVRTRRDCYVGDCS